MKKPNTMTNQLDVFWEAFQQDPREERFIPFYQKTKTLVYSLCYCLLHNEEDASDAFQATVPGNFLPGLASAPWGRASPRRG